MKNKVTILNNLSAEITPISISDLNITLELPSGITVPNDSYGGFIPIHYNIDYDINFSAVKFYLNDELVHTSNKPTDTFNINVTTEFNKLSGYSVNRFDLKLPQTEFEVIFKSTLDQTKSQLEISKILKYNLPNFILDEYPVFVDFIEAYYQFLEKSNNPNLIHYNLENYKDIDNVPEYIVDYFRKELIPNFDLNLAKDRQTGESLNERVLIKHIKEFYDSKGTENSIKFLFRILFDKEATIFYPKVNLLKPSDGLWTIDKTIDVYGTDIVRLYGLAGSRIYQRKTTGEIESHAIIKNVNVKKIPGGFQGSLFLYELSGTFSNTTPILLKEVLDGVSVETPLTVIKISNKNLTISSGRRDSLGGNLSETKRLIPDNDYWQNASYDVQGDADPKSFISIIKKLAHPAGFKIFASYSPTLKLSKTINIKNEVIISNSFGSPKTFLNDLISKTDSLDILLVGDSNIHFGSQDGGYMYGWSYTLDELGVPCYSTPLFPSLTRSLATFAGASGIFKYFPGANTSTNAEYDSATNNYWWKSNSAFGNTGYLVKKDTWLGSTVTDTYATWINNIWKCGTASGTKTTSGWHTFNSLVDWAYIKPGVTTSYDSTRNINIAKTGFSDSDQTLGTNKIYGLNPAWYGNFPVEKELNYRNVNVKFPGTNGGSIYLTSRNATNVAGSATPSYYGRYSTDSGSTTEYKIQADVLPIGANPTRKYVDAAWQGAHSGNFGKGPIATLLESVSVKNQKGYAVNSFHARSGHSAQDIASGLEAAGTESIKIYLKEIRDRQISSGGSGRVLIFVNMGINSNSGAENTLFGNRAERIIVSISTAWSALGYPKSDLGFLISNSHNGGIGTYSNPTAVIATAQYLKNKYSNVMLVNFDNDTLGSITRLTNISGYINANSSVDAKSTGTTNPQVHLSQGRNVLTGTTTKTPNGEGGYAAVISGLITTVKTSNFTSPITSIITDNSTVNNTQENTGLTIGNYLAYSSDIVQDLNFLKTDNTDDSTDITSTYRAFPEGLPFGPDGKTPTVAAKSYISLISSIAAINISQFRPELIEEEVYFRSNIIGGTTFTGASDNKLTSAITNIGQLIGEEEISERWECGNHPRTVLNPSEQIFSPDAAFGDLKISDFVGEEDPRSDREKLLLDKESVDCSKIKNKECREACEAHQRFVDIVTRNDAKSKKELDDMEYANKSEIAWAHLTAAGVIFINACAGAAVKGGIYGYYAAKSLVVGKTIQLSDELVICLNGFRSGMGPLTYEEIAQISMGKDLRNAYNLNGIRIVEYTDGWSRTFNMVKEGDAVGIRCIEQNSLGAPIIVTRIQQQANTLIPELTTSITKLYNGRSTKQAISAITPMIQQELTAKLPVMIDRAVNSAEAARGVFWKYFSSQPKYWDYSVSLEIWERMGATKRTTALCQQRSVERIGFQSIDPIFLKQAEESRSVVVKANIGVQINTPRIVAQAGQNITQATLLSQGLAEQFANYSWGIFTGETAIRRAELSEKNCMDNFEVWNKATTQRIIENKTAWNEYVEAEKKCRPCSDGSSGSGSGASGGGTIGSSGYGTSGVIGGPNSPGLNLLDEPLDPLDPEIIDDINNTLDGFYKSFTVKNRIEESSQDVINRL